MNGYSIFCGPLVKDLVIWFAFTLLEDYAFLYKRQLSNSHHFDPYF